MWVGKAQSAWPVESYSLDALRVSLDGLFFVSSESASPHSAALSTRQSHGIDSTVCEDNPNLHPITHVPARRAVKISTLESPIISVSPGETPASRIRVFSPSGSGFFVAKLFPP